MTAAKMRGETPAQKREVIELLRSRFQGLVGVVPGLQSLEIGVDTSGVAYACDVVLYSEFESQAALDAYASHPEHDRVKRELGDARIARYQVDYVPEQLSQ